MDIYSIFFSSAVGVFIPPFAILVLLLKGQFLILGEFIVGTVFLFGLSAWGKWILMKYKPSDWLMKKIPAYLRYIIAVIVGVVAGNLLAMPLASALGSILGQDAINSTTLLSLANLSYMILIGFITGLFAGLIAGKRGKLIGGIAQFSILIFLIIFSLAINRDILEAYAGQYGVSFWAWVGLLPAILGGHYGVKIIGEAKDTLENRVGMV